MSKTPKITSTQLAKNLSDILNQVRYQGANFTIERNGQALASLGPVKTAKPIHIEEWLAKVRHVMPAGVDFADDLEDIQASQPKQDLPDWPS